MLAKQVATKARGDLRQAPVAHLAEAPRALDDSEDVLDSRSHLGLDAVEDRSRPAVALPGARADWCSPWPTAPWSASVLVVTRRRCHRRPAAHCRAAGLAEDACRARWLE